MAGLSQQERELLILRSWHSQYLWGKHVWVFLVSQVWSTLAPVWILMDPRQEPLRGIRGSSQERLGRWPAIGQEPEWNMGVLGYIRKPLVKGQKRALGAVPKHLSGWLKRQSEQETIVKPKKHWHQFTAIFIRLEMFSSPVGGRFLRQCLRLLSAGSHTFV